MLNSEHYKTIMTSRDSIILIVYFCNISFFAFVSQPPPKENNNWTCIVNLVFQVIHSLGQSAKKLINTILCNGKKNSVEKSLQTVRFSKSVQTSKIRQSAYFSYTKCLRISHLNLNLLIKDNDLPLFTKDPLSRTSSFFLFVIIRTFTAVSTRCRVHRMITIFREAILWHNRRSVCWRSGWRRVGGRRWWSCWFLLEPKKISINARV